MTMASLRVMLPRASFRTSFISTTTRSFKTSPAIAKSAIDSAKDTVKQVDRTVSDAAVRGIDKGEAAAQSAKQTVVGKSQEAAAEAKEKGQELKSEAEIKAEEAKVKKEELKGEAQEKKGEMKQEAKQTIDKA